MWAQSRQQLRLTSEEFWALTPRELHALYEADRINLYRDGLAAAAIYNTSRQKKTDPVIKPMDFFESKKTAKSSNRVASAQEILAKMTEFERLAAEQGGKR